MFGRTIVAVLIVLFFCLSALSTPRLPQLYSRSYPDIDKLTRTWAQDAIGIPETRAFLRQVKADIFARPRTRIGIMDAGFEVATLLDYIRLSDDLRAYLLLPPTAELPSRIPDTEVFHHLHAILVRSGLDKERVHNSLRRYSRYSAKRRRGKLQHGTAVASLLAGTHPFGVSEYGEIDFLFLFIDNLALAEEAYRFSLLAAQETLPDIINTSASFSTQNTAQSELFTPVKLLTQIRKIARQTLVVTSAGNRFPDPIESGKIKLANEIVIVGSSEPAGGVSKFSPAGEPVTVFAPSDEYLQTIGTDGRIISFGGTSGATSLVTGALADVLAILPTLTTNEAIHLLRKTAVVGNGAGAPPSLNYYKLMRVAVKLRDMGWPEPREMIFSDELYDFTSEAQQLLAAAPQSTSFTQLRRAFFLDSPNPAIREKLAGMYAQAGYTTQALFYSNNSIPARCTTKYDFLTALATADTERLNEMLPILSDATFWEKTFFSHIIKHMDVQDRTEVIKFLKEKGIVSIEMNDAGGIKWQKL